MFRDREEIERMTISAGYHRQGAALHELENKDRKYGQLRWVAITKLSALYELEVIKSGFYYQQPFMSAI